MLRYGIYTRKSDDDRSVTEKSISEQMAECARLAERDGLSVGATWEESQSARYPHRRPKYKELIALIERGRINSIVCWHINRLVRNMEEGGKLAQLLIDGTIREIRTPSAVFRTGDNIMPLVIEAASATQFSIDHAKTVKRGMVGSFRAGGCINSAPQGYRNGRDPLNLKKGVVLRDPERFATVRRGWDLMLTGTCTIRQVVDTMNDEWGFRTRPTRKRAGGPLSYSAAYQLFRNPFYAGSVRCNGEMVKGRHEPMVTPDEFDRVQQILRRGDRSAPRTRAYAFTGMMRCVHCGQQVTAEVKRLRDGRLWENYHCADSRLKCTKLGMSRSKVFRRVALELDALEIAPELLALAVENIRRYLESGLVKNGTVIAAQEAALQQTEGRLERLAEMWLDGLITDRAKFAELEKRETAKKNEIAARIRRATTETDRINKNLERSAAFLTKAQSEFKVADDNRIKELSLALADGYLFDGRQKTIEIKVAPLLTEMVKFARKLGRIEPPNTGSGTQKEPTLVGSVPFGGTKGQPIEPGAPLVDTLRGELFPNVWDDCQGKTVHLPLSQEGRV